MVLGRDPDWQAALAETSSADPAKLITYSEAGLELSVALQGTADTLSARVGTLEGQAGAGRVPSLTDVVDEMADLAGDWYHVDEFVGDVGRGFARANNPDWDGNVASLTGGVITADNELLAGLGNLGFADRDDAAQQAIEDADAIKEAIADHGTNADDIRELIDEVTQGQYDPYYAVRLSEELGVDGYVRFTRIIGDEFYEDYPTYQVSREGIAAVGVLGQTLTTALDTLPSSTTYPGGSQTYSTDPTYAVNDEDRHDPDTAGLADSTRLSQDFVRDLVSGYHYDFGTNSIDEPRVPRTSSQDMSVLMRETDPPTSVAVSVANHRLTPMLDADFAWTNMDEPWGGPEIDPVGNYAEMLNRNPDASLQWLDSGDNLELVLDRDNKIDDRDVGEPLADVVETAVTHPTDDEGRRRVMEDSIDIIGGELHEIRNKHLYDSLASGVEANMDVVYEHVNEGWDETSEHETAGYYNTHDFFRELMSSDPAAHRVRVAMDEYAQDQISSIITGGQDLVELERVNRVQNVVWFADGNVEIGEAESLIESQERRADLLNVGVGLLPYTEEFSEGAGTALSYADTLNDIAGISGHRFDDLGHMLFDADYDALDEAEQRAVDVLVQGDLNNKGMLAAALVEAGQVDAPAGLLDANGHLMSIHEMNQEQIDQLIEFVHSDEVLGNAAEGPHRDAGSRLNDGLQDAVYAGLQGRTG